MHTQTHIQITNKQLKNLQIIKDNSKLTLKMIKELI